MFEPGQKVMCVNDKLNQFHVPGVAYSGDLDGLKAGTIYTVRECRPPTLPQAVGPLNVWVVEIIRPLRGAPPAEDGYHVDRFVPLDEFNPRLQQFRELVEPKQLETVDA